MKKLLKFLTTVIVMGIMVGMVFAYVKTDKFLDSLDFILPLADKMHLTRWSSNISTGLYKFLNHGLILNNIDINQNKTAYIIICLIAIVALIGGGALVISRDTISQKTQTMGALCVFFAALFGLDFVLAVIMIGLVTSPSAG